MSSTQAGQSRLQITGIRLDGSQSESDLEDGIPNVLADSTFILRIFGSGITNDTVIAFTNEPQKDGAYCQFPATLLHSPISGSVANHTALYEVKLPASTKKFYICAKEDPHAFEVVLNVIYICCPSLQ